jgi:Zn-dependent protease with chaperone function
MLGGGESCGGSPAVTDAARVLRLHLALAAAGVGAFAFVVAALISALRFEMPPGAEQHSHWELVRSALSPGSVATLALGSLSIAVGIAALASLRRQWRRSRAFVRGLAVVRDHGDVRVIAEDRPLAFCAGLLHPRIHVSTGALAILGPAELDAVLAHERHHVRRRDPLRLFLVRAIGDALFVLPALPRLAERYGALVELGADDAAVLASGGEPGALASALLAFDEERTSSVVGIDPARVDHLCGELPVYRPPVALVSWSVLVVGAIVVVAERVGERLSLTVPLLTQHLCLITANVVPLLLGAAALLATTRGRTTAGHNRRGSG